MIGLSPGVDVWHVTRGQQDLLVMRQRGSVKFTSMIGMSAEVKDGEMSVGSNDLCVREGSVFN